MKPDSKILDDIARMAGGAVSLASSMQQQLRDEIRSHMEDMAARMDLVPRSDLDDALDMIANLRTRIEALEAQTSKPAKKPEAKKTATARKTTKKTVKKK